jgi:hypothetical protein
MMTKRQRGRRALSLDLPSISGNVDVAACAGICRVTRDPNSGESRDVPVCWTTRDEMR